MARVKTAFKAVLPGEVYPRDFAVGDDVTGAAETSGREMGCVEDDKPARAPKRKAKA